MASQPRILAISGELDMAQVPLVREQIAGAVAEQAPRVLLDLSGLGYIDSSGLALFIEQLQRVQAYGGKFALFGLTASVRHIFDVARLDQVFSIFPDRAAALAAT